MFRGGVNTSGREPHRLEGEAETDRAERVAIDHARRGHAAGQRGAHMGQTGRTAGEKQRVDPAGGQPRLF